MKQTIFISGIGTNVGKSYATGWLANQLTAKGEKVITLKMIQTGDDGYSEDIDIHRQVMNLPMQPVDLDFTTAPIIMTYPASPHLAARIDGVDIDLSKIERSQKKLYQDYDTILMEGAGGLMVPITESLLTIDYVADRRLPLALVTNGQLGSINHTLLSLEAIRSRNIDLRYVIYNTFFDDDKTIAAETLDYLKKFVATHHKATTFLTMK
ncbi:MAG: dethiobiotin synthase [Candidatus Limisoma sp.]